MSHLRTTSDPAIWKKGPAFGMAGVHVDGPTIVECETYRFRGHSLADPEDLRDPDEIFIEKAHYASRDPITALKKYMIEHELAREAHFKIIEKKIDEYVFGLLL